ncbi:MAG: Uroporphyrinogen synthase [Segetibacter sp.]|nr:Uroporphyrinogen synthase [Segetibacter sp.]
MKDKEIVILSTRPLDGALIEKAAFQNIAIDTISFIQIKKLVSDETAKQIDFLSKQKATVVFTSMNAVEIVVESVQANLLMPDWKIYCMGGATFTLVKKYWPYDSIVFTAKNATELAERIAGDKVEKAIFFCGNKRREELPVLLQQEHIQVEELVVYETIETPVTIDRTYDGILFFSPSAVNSFFSYNQPAEETILFAIGNTTANAIKQFAGNRIIVSDFPAKDQLVDKAIKYFSERSMVNSEKVG